MFIIRTEIRIFKNYSTFIGTEFEKTHFMKNLLLLCLIILSASTFAQRNPYKNITEKNGMIGIGTDTPDELLTVKGKIHTQEVLVDLNGAIAPDYVFETYFEGSSILKPEYDFPDLEDVSKYISEHHHLPGIPSAGEMASEGLSLKAMNLLLLQKIEELTIYTLEQQKQIDLLQAAINRPKE